MSNGNYFIDQRGVVVMLKPHGSYARCSQCCYDNQICSELAPVEHKGNLPCVVGHGAHGYYSDTRFAVYAEVDDEQ